MKKRQKKLYTMRPGESLISDDRLASSRILNTAAVDQESQGGKKSKIIEKDLD